MTSVDWEILKTLIENNPILAEVLVEAIESHHDFGIEEYQEVEKSTLAATSAASSSSTALAEASSSSTVLASSSSSSSALEGASSSSLALAGASSGSSTLTPTEGSIAAPLTKGSVEEPEEVKNEEKDKKTIMYVNHNIECPHNEVGPASLGNPEVLLGPRSTSGYPNAVGPWPVKQERSRKARNYMGTYKYSNKIEQLLLGQRKAWLFPISASAEETNQQNQAEQSKGTKAMEEQKEQKEEQKEEPKEPFIMDAAMQYLHNFIQDQVKNHTVNLHTVKMMPQNQWIRELSHRYANFLMQELIMAKLKSLDKFIQVKDWDTAWKSVREGINRPQVLDSVVQNRLVYGVYSQLTLNEPKRKFENLIKSQFHIDSKRINELLVKMEAIVVKDLEKCSQGSKPTLVKDSSMSYEITQMLKTVATQVVILSMFNAIRTLHEDATYNLHQFTVLPESETEQWSVLQAYQYIAGQNNKEREDQLDKFRAWFNLFDSASY